MGFETRNALQNQRANVARPGGIQVRSPSAGRASEDLRVRMGGSEAERNHYVVILVSSGFEDVEARPLGDAIARDLRGGARPDRSIPFYDPRSQALDPVDLARFFMAFGVDPNTAQAAAELLTQLFSASQFYEPFYQSIGGQGSVDFDRLAQFYQQQAARPRTPRRAGRARNGRAPARPAPASVSAQAQQARVKQKADKSQATRDAVALHKAMDGWGTDEATLTRILSNRSNAQIKEIKAAYKEMYGESLEDAIKGDTSGDFEDSLLSMLKGNRDESGKVDQAQATRDAAALHEAMDGWGTDEATLKRIISGRSGPQLKAIAKAYQEMYGESLEDAIKGDTSGDFETSLLAQLKRSDTAPKTQGTRRTQTSQTGDDRKARATRDAVRLHQAMDGWGTDEDALRSILSNRSNEDITAIKSAYKEMYGESLEDAIKGDTSGHFEDSLLSMLKGNRDESGKVDEAQATRDAAALHEAMDGWGTDEATLNRIISGRSGPQLKAIAKAYQEMYGESLEDAIKGDTSGDFEKSLLDQLKRKDTAPKKPATPTPEIVEIDLATGTVTPKPDLKAELAARRSVGRFQGQMTAGGAQQVDRSKATRDAVALHEAMDGLGTDEQKLIDVLSNRSNREIRAIRSAYEEMFGESLDDAIKSDTSGDFETMLLKLASGNRSEGGVNKTQATRDAVALHEAIDGWGTDEAALIRILGGRSKQQVKAIADAYESMYGESLRDAIEGDTSGWFETSLVAQLR